MNKEELIPKQYHDELLKVFQQIHEMSITASILRLFNGKKTKWTKWTTK